MEIGSGQWQARLEGLPESDTQADRVERNVGIGFTPESPNAKTSAIGKTLGRREGWFNNALLVKSLFQEELSPEELSLWSQEGEIYAKGR